MNSFFSNSQCNIAHQFHHLHIQDIYSQERRKVCQFIDTRAIYDWLLACSCSLPYWTSFLSETAASSALAGRYEKFRQIGTANRAQTGLLPSATYTGLPSEALVPVLAPARPAVYRLAAPVLMFTTSKSSSYFRARSVPVSEGETPYVFTRFFQDFS